jgi:deoxyribose-phosphate aldolase
MAASDIDRLVEIIADRVKARLGGPSPALPLLRDQPCTEPPSNEACSGCGMCASRRPWSVRAIASEGACRVGAGVDTGKVDLEIARMIDHTLLKADATSADVKKLCEEARKYCFASVCVNSTNVAKARALLDGSGVMVCAVVGFPLGAMTPTA